MSKENTIFQFSIFKSVPRWAWIVATYLLAHVPALLLLPIFADEAIYIHWAQLVIDDASRYAFFSMADGKPPLFMWLLSFSLRPFADPLLAARMTSVMIGLCTVFVVGAIAKVVTGNRRVVIISQLITIFAPFWWFYHRMALMDALLTLCISLSFLFAVRIAIKCQSESGIAYDTIPLIIFLGLSFAAAMLTKTPAIFAIPVLALTPFFAFVKRQKQTRTIRSRLIESVLLVGVGGVIGCVFFLFLRVSPLFGALFARSSDFTFSIKEVMSGEWKFILFSSLPREFGWISFYMTYAVVGCALAGLFFHRTKKLSFFFIAISLVYAAPLIAFGKVLYPRYFLPIAPFLTVAGAIGFERLLNTPRTRGLAFIMAMFFTLQCALFLVPAIASSEKIPFTSIDRMQYLEEWSAGFGNNEVRDFIRSRYQQIGKTKRIIVLTEGAFGTLPDGLSIYFFGPNQLDGVEIHGIGVGPNDIPQEYTQLLSTSEVYYVVNSHRLRIANMEKLEKIFEIHRPNGAPSLELFRVLP